jgi:hypothetical protein
MHVTQEHSNKVTPSTTEICKRESLPYSDVRRYICSYKKNQKYVIYLYKRWNQKAKERMIFS